MSDNLQFLPAERQMELYLEGRVEDDAQGTIPVSFEALEAKAKKLLSEEDFDWIAGGAGKGDTIRANLDAFKYWRIVPRMFRDVSERDLSINLFGRKFKTPVFLAPIGVQKGAHPDGEVAVGKAAASLGIPFILSTVATSTIEEVAEAMGDGERWYQLYWPKDEALAESFIHRAENSGYSAIVLTLDTQSLGWREDNLRMGHLPFLQGVGLQNYFSDPIFRARLDKTPEEDPLSAAQEYLRIFSDLSRSWDSIQWIKDHTNLPVLVKGIQHAEDAKIAMDCGVDGICVSNHGGRQVDGAVGSLQALADVVDTVNKQLPVIFDSGIRRGSDIIKALAMGADAVMVGRPYMYALAIGGEEGVRVWLSNLLADFDINMTLSNHANIRDLSRQDLVEQFQFGKYE